MCYTHTIAGNMAALHEGAQFLDLVHKTPKVSSTLISHGQFSSELTVESKEGAMAEVHIEWGMCS